MLRPTFLLKMLPLALLLCLLATRSVAQKPAQAASAPRAQSLLTTRVRDGKVQLRWFPIGASHWRTALQKGWVVERMELSEKGQKSGFTALTTSPLKPRPVREWQTADTAGVYGKIAYHTLAMPALDYASARSFDEKERLRNEDNAAYAYFILATNLDWQAARATAMGWEDAEVQAGKKYLYRCYIAGLTAQDTAIAVVGDPAQPTPAPEPVGLRAEEGDGAITLYWSRPLNDPYFAAYDLERSADGGKTYQMVNRLPILFANVDAPEIRYVDSVNNYVQYRYRVVGYTYFGDKGQASAFVRAMGRDLSPAVGAVNIQAKGDRGRIEISWELPEISPDLAGFRVGRSADADGQFAYLNEQLLPPSTRRFTDRSPLIGEPFYVVHAVDTAGNVSPAYPAMASVLDTIAPSRPLALSGQCDTLGIVRLRWQPNSEEDLLGYYVFRANSRDDVYRPLNPTPFAAAEWVDTVPMNALNREIFYKITAIDYNYNPSSYSELLVVVRPDLIAPAAPVFAHYAVQGDSVRLEWKPSHSADAERQVLLRKGAAEPDYRVVKTFSGNKEQSFTDGPLPRGAEYRYVIAAVDAAGNQGRSEELALQVADDGRRAPVGLVRANWNADAGAAELSWEYASSDCRFVIYRGKAGEALRTYKAVAGTERRLLDTPSKGAYRYAVKAIFPDGGESDMSPAVDVVAE